MYVYVLKESEDVRYLELELQAAVRWQMWMLGPDLGPSQEQ